MHDFQVFNTLDNASNVKESSPHACLILTNTKPGQLWFHGCPSDGSDLFVFRCTFPYSVIHWHL